MSRDKRRESGTGFYHVVMRGNNKEKIFDKTGGKLEFKNILKKQLDEYPVTIYAYCIMTNNIHLMLEAKYKVLPRFMQRVNSTYAEGYNSKYDRDGHVFQGRYYSDCVETEEYYNTERVRIFTERYLFDNRIEEIENILKTAYKRD